ncbi:MAG: high-affinity nickel-transport family protein [Gemmatimonadaceae bacterium]|nr:high-affinity nickel-transport family protein [Gemmatimonadaceae bacterium]
MIETLPILAIGFALGMGHATDADHVAAVTTIVSRERAVGRAASIGALWGIGHTATIVLVGGAIILFNLVIPPRLGLALEFAVALMLITLGIVTLRARDDSGVERSPMRPVGVGFVHGLAGSAFVAMLVLQTIPSPAAGVLYLLIFGIGTIAGMALVTTAIAVPSAYAASKVIAMRRYIRLGAGALSIIFGVLLAHEVGITGGLFTGDVQWTPH